MLLGRGASGWGEGCGAPTGHRLVTAVAVTLPFGAVVPVMLTAVPGRRAAGATAVLRVTAVPSLRLTVTVRPAKFFTTSEVAVELTTVPITTGTRCGSATSAAAEAAGKGGRPARPTDGRAGQQAAVVRLLREHSTGEGPGSQQRGEQRPRQRTQVASRGRRQVEVVIALW